jgi:hypothetical protein
MLFKDPEKPVRTLAGLPDLSHGSKLEGELLAIAAGAVLVTEVNRFHSGGLG